MFGQLVEPNRRPLIIVGMHRSGTSLTTALLASAGLHVGDRLLGSHPGNELGHFEDIGFLELHKRALSAIGEDEDGYSARPVASLSPDLIAEADRLVADRSAPGRSWGWKDPRTTLFLDFWNERIADARYLFVFRNPADVADSLFRRGDWWFMRDPARTLFVWKNYNALILDFVSRFPDRSLVVEIDDVVSDTTRVFSLIRSKLGIQLGEPSRLFQPELFGSSRSPRGGSITMMVLPEAFDVYHGLRRMAEPDTPLPEEPSMLATACIPNIVVREWARASRAEASSKTHSDKEQWARAELARVDAERAARTEEVRTIAGALARSTDRISRLEADLATASDRVIQVESESYSVRVANIAIEQELTRASAHTHQLEVDLAAAKLQVAELQRELANRGPCQNKGHCNVNEAPSSMWSSFGKIPAWIRRACGRAKAKTAIVTPKFLTQILRD